MSKLASLIALILILVFTSCGDEEYAIGEPKIYFSSDGVYEIGPEDTLTLEPKILYDTNSTYLWTDNNGNTLSTDLNYEFIPQGMKDYALRFSVSNSLGSDTFDIKISVLINATMSEWDNYSTKKTSILALQPDTLPGAYRWEGLEFNNYINADTSMWYGFTFCNKVSTYSSVSSSAIGVAYVPGSTSANSYLAVYATDDDAQVLFSRSYTPVSVSLANDNFLYLATKFGYSTTDGTTTDPVSQNDYNRVLIQGLDKNGELNGTCVFYDLIECSYENPARYYRCTEWVTIPLTDLGTVYGLQFNVETSTTYPELFCIDNLRLQD